MRIGEPTHQSVSEIAPSLEAIRGERKATTKGDQVETTIRGFLASGEIGPGEKISLRKLAAALGVSVMPVRHAVARLQADGVPRGPARAGPSACLR